MKKKKEWQVGLSAMYLTSAEWLKINATADSVDKKYAGAGAGFGCRDIDWYRKTKKGAKELQAKLEAAFKEAGIETETWIEEVEA
jgi:hypothetical protein